MCNFDFETVKDKVQTIIADIVEWHFNSAMPSAVADSWEWELDNVFDWLENIEDLTEFCEELYAAVSKWELGDQFNPDTPWDFDRAEFFKEFEKEIFETFPNHYSVSEFGGLEDAFDAAIDLLLWEHDSRLLQAIKDRVSAIETELEK